MSTSEPTSNPAEPEAFATQVRLTGRRQWRVWGRRARRDAAVYLVCGAATALGGALVSCGALWVRTRL